MTVINPTNKQKLNLEKYPIRIIQRFDWFIKKYKCSNVDLIDYKNAMKINFLASKFFRELFYNLEFDLNFILTSDSFIKSLWSSNFNIEKKQKIKFEIKYSTLKGKDERNIVELSYEDEDDFLIKWQNFIFFENRQKSDNGFICSFHQKLSMWLYVQKECEQKKVKKIIGLLREIRNSLGHSTPIIYIFDTKRIETLFSVLLFLLNDNRYCLRGFSKRTINFIKLANDCISEIIKILSTMPKENDKMSKDIKIIINYLKKINLNISKLKEKKK